MEVKEFGINASLIELGYISTEIDDVSPGYIDLALRHSRAGAYRTRIDNSRKNWSRP